MTFNWIMFLDNRRIEYATRGANIGRNEIGIPCPFCGDDPSQHMAIHTGGDGWCCRRNRTHSGKSPVRLIRELLHCSTQEARDIAGLETPVGLEDDEDVLRNVTAAFNGHEDKEPAPPLDWPKEIIPVPEVGMGRLCRQYLRLRGYTAEEAKQVVDRFHLRCGLLGAFAYRLVIPVYDARGELVCWTGRDITQTSAVRYKTLSTDVALSDKQHLPIAREVISDCLLNLQSLSTGGKLLVVTEGPFDAMRVDFFGYTHRIRGTCLFSKSLSQAQIALLSRIAPKYDQCMLLLDHDAELDSVVMQQELSHLGFETRFIVEPYKDPAEMPGDRLVSFLTSPGV